MMSALLEFQRAMGGALFGAGPDAMDAWVPPGEQSAWRFAVYRDTARATLLNALTLTYPAVHRLVGPDFFAGAAQAFIAGRLPRGACLNDYGGGFADHLAGFLAAHAPDSGLAYLGDVARLEWAVSRALHAPDRPALDLGRLAALDPTALGALRLIAHPSLSLLSLDHPADRIWRAVLDQDDAAMAAVELASGPVWLLVERVDQVGRGVQVQRLAEPVGRFTARLCAGDPLHAALEPEAAAADAAAQHRALAEHLAAGRFVDFEFDRHF